MKPKIDKISIISTIIIGFLISIPGFYAYYFTDWRNETALQSPENRVAHTEFQEDSKIFDKRILLRKDKGITLNKSKLVFKGIKDKMIHLDLYLLELDPDAAYPQYISRADAEKGIRLGDSTYQLLKVNKKTLQLKIVDLYKS